MATIQSPPLTDTELLLLTTPDDTEEAPWMPMPDWQWRTIALLVPMLRRHALERDRRWYVAGELKISMPRKPRKPSSRELDLVPDLLVAMAEDAERSSWNVGLEGAPPALVLEVVTEESWDRDTDEKPALYEAMGVAEYAIFAPRRKDGGPALFGYRRNPQDGWVPWQADGEGRLRSEVLEGLRLYPEGNRLRLLDTAGVPLQTEEELLQREIAARQLMERQAEIEARAREAAERQARIDVEAREAAERQARIDAEAREAAERQAESEARAREAAERQIEREIVAREAAERDGAEAHAEIRRLRALLGGASEQG